ncbi:MAG: DUF5681 domain-containing protein [Alphaproteobacteria bacterium]
MMSDYNVGYGKPPKSGQFTKGKTGNPKGRPKGSKNLKTVLAAELKASITITENGITRNITKREAIVKSIVNRAIKGDAKATTTVFSLDDKLLADLENVVANAGELEAEDKAILDAFVESLSSGKTKN